MERNGKGQSWQLHFGLYKTTIHMAAIGEKFMDILAKDVRESREFPYLVQRYNVAGVPRTVINGSVTIEGSVAEKVFLEQALKADEPEDNT